MGAAHDWHEPFRARALLAESAGWAIARRAAPLNRSAMLACGPMGRGKPAQGGTASFVPPWVRVDKNESSEGAREALRPNARELFGGVSGSGGLRRQYPGSRRW
jgi:hypothetical protein